MSIDERAKRIEEAARAVIEEASWVYSGCPDKYVRDLDVAIKALDAALEPAPPPAPSEECADDFDPDYGKCPACEGRGLVPSGRPYEGQQSICARCGGTGRATKGAK